MGCVSSESRRGHALVEGTGGTEKSHNFSQET